MNAKEKAIEYLNKKEVPVLYSKEFHKAIDLALDEQKKEFEKKQENLLNNYHNLDDLYKKQKRRYKEKVQELKRRLGNLAIPDSVRPYVLNFIEEVFEK